MDTPALTAPRRIGILEADRPAPAIAARYGSYAERFAALFGAAADGRWRFRQYAVYAGELPASADECAGWLLTGSRHGVYDALPWMAPLAQFLRRVAGAGVPLAGICFGHQILAHALGGTVEKSSRGWGLGPHRYALRDGYPWMDGDEGGQLCLNAVHQDQVTVAPPGAEVLAGSDFCPHAALLYGDCALSFQAHPEFDRAFESALLTYLRDERGVLDPTHTAAALDALADPALQLDSARVARWVVRFFEQRWAG